jgi:hypothetical protein
MRRPYRCVVNDAMALNAAGQAVQRCWCAIPAHFSQVVLDAFVVMPNHVHAVLIIVDTDHGECMGANDVATGNAGANHHSPLRIVCPIIYCLAGLAG